MAAAAVSTVVQLVVVVTVPPPRVLLSLNGGQAENRRLEDVVGYMERKRCGGGINAASSRATHVYVPQMARSMLSQPNMNFFSAGTLRYIHPHYQKMAKNGEVVYLYGRSGERPSVDEDCDSLSTAQPTAVFRRSYHSTCIAFDNKI